MVRAARGKRWGGEGGDYVGQEEGRFDRWI